MKRVSRSKKLKSGLLGGDRPCLSLTESLTICRTHFLVLTRPGLSPQAPTQLLVRPKKGSLTDQAEALSVNTRCGQEADR